jgi:Uma2 family endonuclease
MNIELPLKQFTADDFIQMVGSTAFEGMVGSVELFDGYLLEMQGKHLPHVRIQAALITKVTRHLEARSTHLTIVAEAMVRVNDRTVLEPDVTVFHDRPDLTKALEPADIALAIEVAESSLSYDLGAKADRYAQAGIADYWVINLAAKCTHVHRAPTADGYADQTAVPFDQPLTPLNTDLPHIVMAALSGVAS